MEKEFTMKKVSLVLMSLALVASCQQLGAPVANEMSTPVAPEAPMASAMPEAPQMADIVDTAVAAGNFTTLAKALTAANLIETLKGEGPFTVFAPTDAAFAALPEGTLDNLLANPEELAKVLTYHVVAGNVPAADVVNLSSATTVEGSDVAITVTDGKVMVNGANVTQTDIKTSNGTIHVIDAVLLPPTN
jgi:uncharacterized surface protein with fasciclin (FAS1) repeats